MTSPWYDNAKVIAQLKGEPLSTIMKTENPTGDFESEKTRIREITVIETGEASLMPDIAKVLITHKSLKVLLAQHKFINSRKCIPDVKYTLF